MEKVTKQKAIFKELWNSSVVEAASLARLRSRLEFAREAELDEGLVSSADAYYILVDNCTGGRAENGEPYYFKDYITKKHTFEIFQHALSLGLKDFSIFFDWDIRYFETFEDKFDRWTMSENGGDGGSQELFNLSRTS